MGAWGCPFCGAKEGEPCKGIPCSQADQMRVRHDRIKGLLEQGLRLWQQNAFLRKDLLEEWLKQVCEALGCPVPQRWS